MTKILISLAVTVVCCLVLLACGDGLKGDDDSDDEEPDADTACRCDDPAATRACIAWCGEADAMPADAGVDPDTAPAEQLDAADIVRPDAQSVDCSGWDAGTTCSVDYPDCWPGDPPGSGCPWWDAVTDAGGPS